MNNLPSIPPLLDGKIAAVTGATRGIGLATALTFARAGAAVFLMGRSADALARACQQVREDVPQAAVTGVPCDVADPASVRDAFQAVFRAHKRLDVLVANAGVMQDALIGMVTPEQIQSTFATNAFGIIYGAQYASRLMARAGGGSLINISSIIASHGNAGNTVYGGSKAAVNGITLSLARELAHHSIRVNAIAPGFIDTDLTQTLGPQKFQERLASIKMGRIGSPQEVANVALFLASDLSSYVTGQIIGVDGGMLI